MRRAISGLNAKSILLRSTKRAEEIGHALQADADGGEIMQHGRGGRLQDAQSTQRDKGRVEGEHEAVVCVHALLQRVGDGLEGHQLLQTVGFDGYIGDLAGDGSAGVDGNANVGSRVPPVRPWFSSPLP